MGEVYRAHDPRLGRDVALKVLRHGKFRDDELRRRFVQEATAAGALNHPNIVAVFDVNLDGETPYIVSELVEGESLRKLLDRGALPVRKLVDIAVQVADGMAAAHQASIVHRDLKPENILLARDGRAKIADFGLAKSLAPATEDASDESPTVSMSALGVVIGTVDYMSPEQASGKRVDTRSDIFAFGLILYEMAAGRRAFVRPSKVETLEAIINSEAPPLPEEIPPPLAACIERCLAKEPQNRYNSTLDLHHDLRGLKDRSTDKTSVSTGMISSRGIPAARKSRRVPWLVAGVAGAMLAGALGTAWWLAPRWPDPALFRFQPLAIGREWNDRPAWSPQEGILAFQSVVNGHTQIFTRSLQSPNRAQVTHGEADAEWPAWSADGRRIFFRSQGRIWVVGAAGGQPEPVLAEDPVYAVSPDGQSLAFIRRNSDFASISVWISSPPGAEPKHYTPAPFEGPTHDGGGRLYFTTDGKHILLWARFLVRGPEFWLLPYPPDSGRPRRVLEQATGAFVVRGFAGIPGSSRVVLAAALPPANFRSHLYLADLDSGAVHLLAGGIGSEAFPVVSPDGKQIAYSQMEYDSSVVEVPLDGSVPRTLVANSRLDHSPAWSPRGREFAYVTDRSAVDEILIRNVDTGREQQVVTARSFPNGEAEFLTTPVFSPDGDRIAFVRHNRTNPANRDITEIWIAPATGGAPVRVADARGDQWAPTWSPDGNWIAFTSLGPPSAILKVRVGGNGIAETVWPLDVSLLLCTPEWSPRGDWIATASKEGAMLLSPDGKIRRILRKPAFSAAAWSHDGSVLYGLEDSGGNQRIVAANVDRPGEREVARLPPGLSLRTIWLPGRRMSLSPDGKSLAATAIHQGASIWMLEDFDLAPRWQRLFRR